MNGKQLAALGPRYGDFKAVYGHSSGVALGVALAYGIDVDAFTRPEAESRIEGELVLKVWSRQSKYRMLWCYVASDDGSLACFPLFPSSKDAPGSAVRATMAAPLGCRMAVELECGERGRTSCTGASWL